MKYETTLSGGLKITGLRGLINTVKWQAMDSDALQSMAMSAPKGKRNSSVVLEFEDKAITELFRFIAKLGAQNKIAKTV